MISNPNKTKDYLYFRQVGTSPYERWFSPNVILNLGNTGGQSVGTIRAQPFVSGRSGVLDSISFEITTGGAAGAVARCGIYEATSDTNIYPKDLIVDGGEFDTTTNTVKTASISVRLKPNTLYWLATLSGVNSATWRLSGSAPSCVQALGIPAAFGASARTGLTATQAYGALPNPFTSGAVFATGGLGSVAVHYAS